MSSSSGFVQLAGLQTELRNSRSADIDHLSTLELCALLNSEDSTIHQAVESCVPVIADTIDAVSSRMRRGGRLFYIGAGTSGRLGVLDASEIPPTYSAPKDQFVALVAGGDYALRYAKEGAEDDRDGAKGDLEPFNLNPEVDSLIGIASSGRTPYVLGGLSFAKALGCTTIGLVCTSPSEVAAEGMADYVIAAVTGAEVVTGSTRMRAGTATKLVLNMISTGIMIKLGKTYGNLMVDLKATNIKLRQRARNVLRAVAGPSCMETDADLDVLLSACHGSVKLACASLATGLSVSEAEKHLSMYDGVLARVIESSKSVADSSGINGDSLVLCVDAGGSSCKAVILSGSGLKLFGSAGPCNVSTIGIENSIASITSAIVDALSKHSSTQDRRLRKTTFTSAWVALAGYDRPNLRPQIDEALSKLLGLSLGDGLTVTTDIDLLPASITSRTGIDTAIVLVAGTGSVAMKYKRHDSGFICTGRAGGWGHLLGDDGSGFSLGREGARIALQESDVYRSSNPTAEDVSHFSPLAAAILEGARRFDPSCHPNDLLSGLLRSDAQSSGQAGSVPGPAGRIAQLAEVVLSLAEDDAEARAIAEAGAASLSKLVVLLIRGEKLDLSRAALVLGGGLMQNDIYRTMTEEALRRSTEPFAHVEIVSQPAIHGAQQLLSQ